MSEWQDIKTAPKDGTSIIILSSGQVSQGHWQGPTDGALYSGRPSQFNWFCEVTQHSLYDPIVTHWMPIPELP